jgi:tetratricopeptide (TPR) repeat protein
MRKQEGGAVMPEQNHEGRAVLITKIDEQLSRLTTVVQMEVKNNLSTRVVLAETILSGLLNRIYGWKLINANRIHANYHAVDLVDADNRIAVQVSSTNSITKIDHTLEQFRKYQLEHDYDQLYVVTITTDNPTPTMRTRSIPKIFSGDTDIWNIPSLVGKVADLGISVLEDIHAYLTLELGRCDPLGRYLYLPPRSAVGNGFVGRVRELSDIQKQLDCGRKPVVLSGLGGMGKTELAAKFGRDYRDGTVYFVHFQDSFMQTVRAMFSSVVPQPTQPPKESEQFDTVMQLLARCTEKDLLIVDNVDAAGGTLSDLMKDDAYKKLQQMQLRLILTTRFEYSGAVEIEPLEELALFQIFQRHNASVNMDAMRSLIHAVSGHTLTVDLIARTLADNWVPVSPEEMLDALHNNTLAEADFAEIDADYGSSPEQKQIYQHLRAVFNVAKIPNEERTILHYATLLPKDGMDLRLFRSCLSKELLKAFPYLGKRGWLISNGSVLQIHPVVRLVCREELNPTDESCDKFLYAVWKHYDRRQYNAEIFQQFAELFSLAADILPDIDGDRASSAGIFWDKLGQPFNALRYHEQAVRILEQKLPNSRKLATAYNNLGSTYSQLGSHTKALEYKLKGLEIRETLLHADHPLLANSYNNVGLTYSALHNYTTALEYQLKAMKIREKIIRSDRSPLASSYNNVGGTYAKLGNYEQALKYQLKALEIREAIFPADHPDLASSYNNVGCTYRDLQNYDLALEYQLKALCIRKKVLPADHPDLALSRNNLGCTYSKLGDHNKALEYQLNALERLERVLPPQHPYITYVCKNLSHTYNCMGDIEKEMEYQKRSGLTES